MSTFYETNKLVEQAMAARQKASLAAVAPGGTAGAPPAGTGPLGPICAVYAAVKPILKALQSFPLIPSNWRQIIGDLLNLMDGICPSSAVSLGVSDFNAIDADIKRVLGDYWRAGGVAAIAPTPGLLNNLPKEICSVYQAVKPILSLVAPILPLPWQAGITAFMEIMDLICK